MAKKSYYMLFFLIAIIAILIFMFFMGSREHFSADYKCINVEPIFMKPVTDDLKDLVPLIANVFSDGNRLITWMPKTGTWYIKGLGPSRWGESTGNVAIQSGQSGDKPFISNVFGDGNRLITWRPANGTWYIKGKDQKNWSQSNGNVTIQNGLNGDVPLIANVFGDGNRLITWRPSNGTWYIKGSGQKNWAQSSGNVSIPYGQKGDIPFINNIFGDGVRLILWRPSNGTWYISNIVNNVVKIVNNVVVNKESITSNGSTIIHNSLSGDVPLIANVFEDGNRLITWRPSTTEWNIKGLGKNNWAQSSGNSVIPYGGKSGDIPLIVNAFGDGNRLIIWRPSTGTWYMKCIEK